MSTEWAEQSAHTRAKQIEELTTELERLRPYAAVAKSEGWRPCAACGDLELPQARCYCTAAAVGGAGRSE